MVDVLRRQEYINSAVLSAAWIINSLTRFWCAVAVEGSHFGYPKLPKSCLTTLLELSRRLLGRLASSKFSVSIAERAALLFSQMTTFFLRFESLPLADTVEKTFCLFILEFVLTAHISLAVGRIFVREALPSICDLVGDQRYVHNLRIDLKVLIELRQ